MTKMERIALPPLWCSQICRNSMNQVCVENCTLKRDTSAFELTQGLKLIDMPKFPDPKGMTREEKFAVVAVYLTKVVETLQGVEDEYITVRKSSIDRSPSRKVSPVVQVKNLLPDLTQAISPLSDQQERADTGVGIETMAQPAD
jgi:hypothetical protein